MATNTPPLHPHQSNTLTKQASPSPSPSTTIIRDKLKASIIERLTKLYPNKTLSSSQINSIQLQLQHAFPSFTIPTHPTYSIMIEKAIHELKEEDGSSEEAISEYISANYEGLPWAHKKFLTHYLDKLCKDGEVVCISSNRYTVPWLIDEFSKKKVHPSEVDYSDGNVKNVIVEEHDNVVEHEKVLDDRVEPKEDDGTNEEHHIPAVDQILSVVDDVTGGGSSLACDPCEEKSEHEEESIDMHLPTKKKVKHRPNSTKGLKLRIVFSPRKKCDSSSQIDNDGLLELDPKLSESSMSETTVPIQQGHISPAFGSNSMISVIEGAVKHDREKQKLHSEFLSMEDGDFNLPLQQVLKMHSKRRKSSPHAKLSKITARKIPLRGNIMTRHKRKEKVLHYDSQKSCAYEKRDVEPPHEITEENGGKIVNSPLEYPSVKPSSPSRHDVEYDDLNQREVSKVEEDPLKQNESDVQFRDSVPDLAVSMKEKTPHSNRRSLKNKVMKKKQRRGRFPSKKNENLDDAESQKQEGLSELGIHEKSEGIKIGVGSLKIETCKVKKKDGRGRPRKIIEITAKDLPPPLDLFAMRQKELEQSDGGEDRFLEEKDKQGVPNEEPASIIEDGQIKKDPPISEVAEKYPFDLNIPPQESPETAIHDINPSSDDLNVFSTPVERKSKQLNVSCSGDKVPITLEGPVSLRTRSKQGGAHKPEGGETLLGKEQVPKVDYEKNSEELEGEVHNSASKTEQVTNGVDDVTLLVEQPCEIIFKRKSGSHIPPSAIRRSKRISQQS